MSGMAIILKKQMVNIGGFYSSGFIGALTMAF